jgi:hypothetical protein
MGATRGSGTGRRCDKRGREARAPVNATLQPTKLYGRDEKQRRDERGRKAKAPGNAKQCKATQQPTKDKRQRCCTAVHNVMKKTMKLITSLKSKLVEFDNYGD